MLLPLKYRASLGLLAFAWPLVAMGQAQPAPAGTTLRANARIVVVDVVVTDRNGAPVHDLKQADFGLTEENEAQTITHFEEHTYIKTTAPAAAQAIPPLPTDVFTNLSPAPANGPINVLLLDELNTPMTSQSFLRQQLLKYLDTVQPGTRIAIFGLNARLLLLQGFTSDPKLLREVMNNKSPTASHLLDDAVGGGGTQNSLADDMEDSNTSDDPNVTEMIANMRQFEAMQQSFQLQMRAKYTLDAMNQIAHYLAGIPGRKNLIWFSGSFPIDILPDTSGNFTDVFAAVASSEDEFRETIDLLSRSQVAVYPIDARGLFNAPVFDASTSRNYAGRPARMQQDLAKFSDDTAAEHITMRQMAASTGGVAYVDTNGLATAVASAIDHGSNYYTFTYTPSKTPRSGDYRKIKVRLAQQGYTLSYRQGYYIHDADRKATAAAASGDAASTTSTASTAQQDTMRIAMMRGAPTPSEIIMVVGVVPSSTQPEEKLVQGNVAATGIHGPYRRFSVNYSIQASDLTFTPGADGKGHGDLELITLVYTPDGVLVNSAENTAQVASAFADPKRSFPNGIHVHQEISTPAKGQYFLRIGVRDMNRDRYGAIEVSTSAIKELPRPAPSQPAPAAKAAH